MIITNKASAYRAATTRWAITMIPLSLSSLSHTPSLWSHCRCSLYHILHHYDPIVAVLFITLHHYDPTATPLIVLFITYVITTIPLSLSSLTHTSLLRSHCHCPLYHILHHYDPTVTVLFITYVITTTPLPLLSLSSLSDNIRHYYDPIVTVLFITYVITTIPLSLSSLSHTSLLRSHSYSSHCPLYHTLIITTPLSSLSQTHFVKGEATRFVTFEHKTNTHKKAWSSSGGTQTASGAPKAVPQGHFSGPFSSYKVHDSRR